MVVNGDRLLGRRIAFVIGRDGSLAGAWRPGARGEVVVAPWAEAREGDPCASRRASHEPVGDAIAAPGLHRDDDPGAAGAGRSGFKRLGTDLFPDVSFLVVMVTAAYPGALTRSKTQVKPVEDAVIGPANASTASFSREGLSDLGHVQAGRRHRRRRDPGARAGIADPLPVPSDVKSPDGRFALRRRRCSPTHCRVPSSQARVRRRRHQAGAAAGRRRGRGQRHRRRRARSRSRSTAPASTRRVSPAAVVARLRADGRAGRPVQGGARDRVRTVGELAASRPFATSSSPARPTGRRCACATSAASRTALPSGAPWYGPAARRSPSRSSSSRAPTPWRSPTRLRAARGAEEGQLSAGMHTDLIIAQACFIWNSVDQVEHDRSPAASWRSWSS